MERVFRLSRVSRYKAVLAQFSSSIFRPSENWTQFRSRSDRPRQARQFLQLPPFGVLLMLLVVSLAVVPAPTVSQTCAPNGDVDGDGRLTGRDALWVFEQALLVLDPPLDACGLMIADVHPVPTAADGRITGGDALCIFERALGLPSCLDPAAGTPFAESLSFQADPSVPYVEKQLIGTDPDGDTLTYELLDAPTGTGYVDAVVGPETGILSLSIAAGFTGEILLHYRVTDGRFFSAPATVRITVEVIAGERLLGAAEIEPEEVAALLTADRSRLTALPPRVNLDHLFPTPGDQLCQGSCTAWAVAYAVKTYQERIEVGWALNTPRHIFSPAFIYNQINGGADRGSKITDAFDLIVRRGAATLATMPYDGGYKQGGRCVNKGDFLGQPTAAAFQEASNFKALYQRRLNGILDIKGYLAEGIPAVIGMETCDAFSRLRGANSVYNTFGGFDCGGHTVTITGYDDNRYGGAFRVINSWSTGWGDGGYFWLPYGFFNRAVATTHYGGANILVDAENNVVIPPDPVPPIVPDDLPNLQVQSWHADYDPRPRGLGTLQYRVVNTGLGVAPAGWDVNFMLSENQRITSADTYVVRERIRRELGVGNAVYRDQQNELEFSFPDGLAEGTYWMAVWVDDLLVVDESNEDDNVSLGRRRVTIENTLPDLYVRNWHARWDGRGNGSLTYRVDNIGRGSVDADHWDINLVLSPDEPIGNGNEIYLFYEDATRILNPGGYVFRDDNNPAYFQIDVDAFGYSVPYGSYYMALWVDDLQDVAESNELNNYSLGSNLVDLFPSVASAPGGGAKAVVLQSPLVQPNRQVVDRLYNGHELPPHDALVKRVQIQRTPQGGTSLTVLDDTPLLSLSADGAGDSLAPSQQRSSADIIIFPVVEEFPVPDNNPTGQGDK